MCSTCRAELYEYVEREVDKGPGQKEAASVDRRRFLLTSLASAVAAPLVAEGQQAGKIYTVGWLHMEPPVQGSQPHPREAFVQDGRNIALEYRFAERRIERLPDLAAELVRLKVDLILAANNPQATAARQATTTIPIVMSFASDPVGKGLVASLARPGGNITGLTTDVTPETWGKRLQLLKELVPKISRAAVLSNSAFRANAARWKPTQDAAQQLGVTLLPAEIRGPDDLENASAIMVQGRAEGFVVFTDPVTHALRSQMAGLAAKNRLPAVYPWREAVDAGGLAYIDKILQGAKPGDLPDEVRAGHQPQDGEGPRPNDPALSSAAGGSGN